MPPALEAQNQPLDHQGVPLNRLIFICFLCPVHPTCKSILHFLKLLSSYLCAAKSRTFDRTLTEAFFSGEGDGCVVSVFPLGPLGGKMRFCAAPRPALGPQV